MRISRTSPVLFVLALTLSGGCKDDASATAVRQASVAPSTSGGGAVIPQGTATPKPPEGEEWVPAENKQGAGRWKDTGVYLDGKPVGFLNFGELPITLRPTWVKDKVSANKRPGTQDPGWRWAQQRFYRFDQYLAALGIEPATVKEIHVYGPKLSQTNISTGKDLTSPAAAGFMFRFGSNVAGKPIPQVPYKFGNGKTPDKISGVMIYVEKTPPTLTRDGLELAGEPQTGIPYFGDPLRGGVRVYLDDKLAMIIKRQDLNPAGAKTAPDGELRWNLYTELAAKGVDTAKIVELWALRNELREEKLAGGDLVNLTFEADAQAKGGVRIVSPDGTKTKANVIALHTRPIAPAEIPVVVPDDL